MTTDYLQPLTAGIVAGFLQFLTLRRQGLGAGRWLALWLVGLLVSLVPRISEGNES